MDTYNGLRKFKNITKQNFADICRDIKTDISAFLARNSLDK